MKTTHPAFGTVRLDHRRLKLAEAQAFVAAHHRHSAPLRRHAFSIGAHPAWHEHTLIGVATVDVCSSHEWSKRPDHIEIRRLCTLGHRNVASFLLGKAVQACFAIGYRCVVTYTQPHESGASLKAAGFWVQKRKRMVARGGEVEGGLVQWIKARGLEPTARDRAFTNRVVAEANAFCREHDPKRSEAA